MESGITEKQSLRASYLSLRLNTDETYIALTSRTIADRILPLEIVSARRRFGLYLPVKNEVMTRDIIDRLIVEGKEVFLPRVTGDEISFASFNGWDRIARGPYGIPEPCDGAPISKDEIEAVFVPGIVFSKNKFRIGFGKGYYDRFLSDYSGTTIGLAFDFQVIDRFAVDGHDIPLDTIGTQSRIIT